MSRCLCGIVRMCFYVFLGCPVLSSDVGVLCWLVYLGFLVLLLCRSVFVCHVGLAPGLSLGLMMVLCQSSSSSSLFSKFNYME